MKRSVNNILVILFPVLAITLFTYFSKDASIILGLRYLYTSSIVFDFILILVLGGYAYFFIIKRWQVDLICLIVAQIITIIFILIDFVLIYIPILYNIINNNLVVAIPIALTIFTTNILIMFRKR